MIQRMFINFLAEQVKLREYYSKKLIQLKKTINLNNSDELKIEIKKIQSKIPKDLFFAENCDLLNSGGFKRGKLITFEDIKRLIEYGFYLIWVTDESFSEKKIKEDLTYLSKEELIRLISRYIVVFNESDAKKLGSNLKYLRDGDLLRRTIEPIQIEGAKYLMWKIFGNSCGTIKKLKYYFNNLIENKFFTKVNLFSNTSLGNLYKKEKNIKNRGVKEKSNYLMQIMIHTALSFISTIKNIQKLRIEKKFEYCPNNRTMDSNKRYLFNENKLIEGAIAAFFCDYGYCHKEINDLVENLTNPFYTIDGKFNGSGIVSLTDNQKLLCDKHVNVSRHLILSIAKDNFSESFEKDILQYHHSYLNNMGYPKRRLIDKSKMELEIQPNSSISSYVEKCYDLELDEITRLIGIINLFVDLLFHTPFHIPFARDNLVRYFLINSVYLKDNNSNINDKYGLKNIDTTLHYNKQFDGFLVEQFLSAINIYQLEEKVPLYSFGDSKKKLYDAIVVSYNKMPHRPILRLLKEDKIIDLSEEKNINLFIGEYYSALCFQDVIDHFYFDKTEKGVFLFKNYSITKEKLNQSNLDNNTSTVLDDIFTIRSDNINFDQNKSKKLENEVDNLKKNNDLQDKSQIFEHYSIYIERKNELLPYGIGYIIGKDSNKKRFQINYLAQYVAEDFDSYFYRYMPVNEKDQQIISIDTINTNLKSFNDVKFVVKNKYDISILNEKISKQVHLGGYYLMYYFAQMDPKKNKKINDFKPSPKYIVQIKKIQGLNLNTSIVKFIRYIHIIEDKISYIKDKNCGKDFNLADFPFFKLGKELSANQLIQYLKLILV